jgi:hypothetical protein
MNQTAANVLWARNLEITHRDPADLDDQGLATSLCDTRSRLCPGLCRAFQTGVYDSREQYQMDPDQYLQYVCAANLLRFAKSTASLFMPVTAEKYGSAHESAPRQLVILANLMMSQRLSVAHTVQRPLSHLAGAVECSVWHSSAWLVATQEWLGCAS